MADEYARKLVRQASLYLSPAAVRRASPEPDGNFIYLKKDVFHLIQID